MLALAFVLGFVLGLIFRRSRGAASRPEIGLHVSTVKGLTAMSDVRKDPVTISDAEYIVVSLNPDVKDAGGVNIPADQFAWASNNEGVIALLPTYTTKDGEFVDPGPYGRVATTPTVGSADVVVTHIDSGNTETQPLIVKFSAPGEFGLSVGTPAKE
jgi:hypothetical protein